MELDEGTADPSQILKGISDKQKEQLKNVTVEKDIDLQFDLGNLLACDPNPFTAKKAKSIEEKFIKDLTRDNTQLLFNEIWKLPVERMQEAIVAKIPKAKPLTKWEEYAKLKGIQKRKRGAMVWDETAKEWKPRFGYKRANDETKEWVIEVPANADPYEDQFEKRLKAKKERVAKNELQRLRNIARRTGKPMPGSEYLAGQKQTTSELQSTFHMAKRATASLGRFEDQMKHEKPEKNRGKKRKFDPVVGGVAGEKAKQLSILKEITSKQPRLNKDRAANLIIHQENQSRANDKPKSKKKQHGSKKFNKRTGGKAAGGKRKK